MSSQKTYKSYKEFFEEVNKSNNNGTYHYSYVLLFSFFEDRLNQIYRTQCEIKHGVKPSKDEEKYSNHQKLKSIESWGLPISSNHYGAIDKLSVRRNIIIHEALFNIKTVSKSDVDLLLKVGRYFNKMRQKQKKDNPKLFPILSVREKILIKLYGRIPSQIR